MIRFSVFPLVCLLVSIAPARMRTYGSPPPKYPKTTMIPMRTGTVTISYAPGHPLNTFIPCRDLGAGVDGHEKGDIVQLYRPANIEAMRSAGLLPLTYRLRTELGIEAWHWNPHGNWSDIVHKRGYWTSDTASTPPISISNGYALPRRGNSIDQANNLGYSRLDDGDANSFWKSNPYLDPHFTGDKNNEHAQWVLIDLVRPHPLNTIKISWGAPYATEFRIEYWKGIDFDHLDDKAIGTWTAFPGGVINDGKGGTSALQLCNIPIRVRYVRILLLKSSETSASDTADIRDRLGYAIREIYIGTLSKRKELQDIIRHEKDGHSQTRMFTSSTDPWHRPKDRDPAVEQCGFDALFHSKLDNGLPVMMPVGVLYDTPDNAAAELRYFRSKGYRVNQIEMGEEPDGQYVTPEDYGALFVQFATALHKVDRNVQIGGPGLQSETTGWRAWADRKGDSSWVARFLAYLRNKRRITELSFFSFEWYPFDDVCGPARPQLLVEPELLGNLMAQLQNQGLPHNIPWIISEYGYSSFAGRQEVDIPAALLNAEIVGQFLTLGGNVAYLYGYEPDMLINEAEDCKSWGNVTMLLADADHQIKQKLPAYYGAWLLTHQWALPGSSKRHEVYRATSSIKNSHGQSLVTAYAVHRPGGIWALLLINKDPTAAYRIKPEFHHPETGKTEPFAGAINVYQYSSKQFVWHPNGENGHADPDLPPAHYVVSTSPGASVDLPSYSLTVISQKQNLK